MSTEFTPTHQQENRPPTASGRWLRACAIAALGVSGWVATPVTAAAAAAGMSPVPASTLSLTPTTAGVEVETVVQGLKSPWALAFLPGNEGVLITERAGRLLKFASGKLSEVSGVPTVYARGQGGLLDVALAPDFPTSRHVYLGYAEQDDRGRAGTAVGRGVLSADGRTLQNFNVIFRQMPKLSSGQHFGVRLVFDRDGYLFIALGENNQRPTAQDLDKHQGKLIRLHADGSVPPDNPFVGKPPARPEIFSYGHRNQQGAALNPWTGRVWTHEHGPRGGDEINIPEAGLNYGWPIATHGRNYSGFDIPESKGAEVAGMQPPHYVWAQSPAISGMAFYDATQFAHWRHSLFVGALKDRSLIRLQLDGDRVVAEERLLGDRGERIRDVRVGPDGYVYVLTEGDKGSLLKLSPKRQ